MRFLVRDLIGAGLAALALLALSAGLAVAGDRVALVVGNSAYRNVPQLPNPANDAGAMAAALGRLGFAVELVKDAGFDDLRRALIGFGAKARESDMAVLYFAGHGMEVAGENWAIPVDASLAADSDVENEAIGLKSLTLAVSGARGLGLVILDACRNNPFDARMQHATRTRAVSRGLAPIEPAGNVLVAFAAKDGTTATDGDGGNSPFTAALLKHIETPGLEVDFLLRNVRDDVLAATDGRQQPFAYGSLSREAVYLKPAEGSTEAQAKAAPAADEVAWPYVAATTDAALVRRFTAQYPASRHRAEADQRLAVLDAAAAAPPAQLASAIPTPAAAAAETKPAAKVADLSTPDQTAVARRFNGAAPQVEQAWSLIKTSADPALVRRFTAEFPSRDRRIVSAALNGIGSTTGVLRQLRAEEMHAVLAGYGRFVQHPRYGEVWVPGVTPQGWHPYEPCHWVRTKQFDWFYLDRTPWGAIVHHYGRWAHDGGMGWIWVPGADFSPGWVAWRVAPGQVGWAPLPPAEDVRATTDAHFDNADFWTFMDRAAFERGCGGATNVVPASAVYVREVRIVAGLPVLVLPVALVADPLDVEVAFDPWPAWLVAQAIVDWNLLWAKAPACLPPAPAPAKAKPPPPPPAPAPAPAKQAKTKHQQQAKPQPLPAPAAIAPPRRRVPIYEPAEPVLAYPPRTYYPAPRPRPAYPVGGFGVGGFGFGGLGRGGPSAGRIRY